MTKIINQQLTFQPVIIEIYFYCEAGRFKSLCVSLQINSVVYILFLNASLIFAKNNPMITFLLSIIALVAGYLIYGRFVEKVFGINKRIPTPAKTS